MTNTTMQMDQITTGTQVHMVGIGGVSMSPLAQVLHSRGVIVTGSDGQESPAIAELRALGIPVAIGHNAEHVGKAQCIIRTAAVHEDNPEIAFSRQQDLPVFERAEGWGSIMKSYQNALCIAGTHGKTTTTAMSAQIFIEAEQDPTFMLGGVHPLTGKGYAMGQGDTIILESCEYCNSFHYFFPSVAVLLNVEADHLDFFKDLDDVKRSFRGFLEKVPPPEKNGVIIVCREDENALDVAKNLPHLTYAVDKGDIYAKNLRFEKGFPTFHFVYQGEDLGEITLQVPGHHNVLNALAAAAAAYALHIPFAQIASALGHFTGAGRRFQHKGTYHGATVVDDYAHHPTELQALLSAVKTLDYKRILCIFQPHTYTRTKAFFKEFQQVLQQADHVFLMDIYAAREPDTGEVSSQRLAEGIPNCTYTGENTLDAVKSMIQEGDLVLTVGAGDVFLVGEALVNSQ